MEKARKKKPTKHAGAASGAGTQKVSAYRTLVAEGKTTKADNKFQKEFGKARDTLRKG